MKKGVIIGTRADEHAQLVLDILLPARQYEVAGFVDENPAKKGQNWLQKNTVHG